MLSEKNPTNGIGRGSQSALQRAIFEQLLFLADFSSPGVSRFEAEDTLGFFVGQQDFVTLDVLATLNVGIVLVQQLAAGGRPCDRPHSERVELTYRPQCRPRPSPFEKSLLGVKAHHSPPKPL